MPNTSLSPGTVDILLVDDQPANLLALEAILSDPGQNLLRAASGEQALELLAARDVAVVLLDVRMPGLSGFETAKRMRASERTRHTPVIFLSAAESDEFPVVEAYRLGAVDFLLKPLIPDILRAKVAVFVELFRRGERLRDLERRERERVEAALRETEQRFARFMEHLPGLAWIKDAGGRYLYANDAAERAFGTPRAKLYGKTDDEVFPPDTAARFRANDRLALASPAGIQTVETLAHPDGEVRHSLVSKFPIPGPDGRTAMVGGVAIDVTDRLRAEAGLRASEARYRALVEATSQAVWSWNPSGDPGDFALSQQWWSDLTGQTPTEQNSDANNWLNAVHPDDRGRVAAAWATSVNTGALYDAEYRVRAKAGGWRHIHARGVPVREADGAIREWIGTMDDVTEQREAEEARREAARRKDEFLAMLAHELRNPLAPLRNSLHILQLRGGDPAVVDRVREMMDRQVTHLGRLVDDLLDVSRITSGKVQLRKERLDLVGIVRQAVHDHRAAFEKKQVTLTASAAASPLWVSGDPTRLAQVLDNLLANALKFTGPGGEVQVSVAADRAGRAVLAVRDSGAGLEPEMLARLFEPFSQADRTLDRSQGGLGLGLAIVKGLTELHGGNVRAESGGLGRGATFTVTLPTAAEPPAVLPMTTTPHAAGRRLRVLVVEDNRDAADSLRMLLEAYGYRVEVAYSGPDGVRAAEEHRPDVVVCDIGLPGMDGYAVAGALRRNPRTASSRLIALTGYGQEEDRRRAREAGFDEHLTKPADPAVLHALLAAASAR
jgi:PAS domain S-box-containing protein